MPGTLIFVLIVAPIIASILGNILASLLEKYSDTHPRIRSLSLKSKLIFIMIFYILVSIPSVLIQLSNLSKSQPEPLLPTASIRSSSNSEVITIEKGQTASVFNNDLFITVNKVLLTEDGRQIVSAVIGSPGYKNQDIKDVELGYSVAYSGKHMYSVRIANLRLDIVHPSATFLVTRIDK